ncbi:MAG: CmcI family methyltransferase [Pseudomonadota bacterium]
MKLIIDEEAAELTIETAGDRKTLDLYSDRAFEAIARQYVRVGWNQKHTYTFSWMGRPVIQFPDDMVRMQEVIHALHPDLVIETGVAHGGSLIFYASLMEAMGHGRVLGIDIEIRPHNRTAIEAHPLFHRIDLLEGSSTAPEIVAAAHAAAEGMQQVLVILDSNHSYAHVREELEAYADLVTPGSYIVATDGVMRDVVGVPRAGDGWETDNPAKAAEDWVADHPDFELVQPDWPFNESTLGRNITHFPSAFLRRRG